MLSCAPLWQSINALLPVAASGRHPQPVTKGKPLRFWFELGRRTLNPIRDVSRRGSGCVRYAILARIALRSCGDLLCGKLLRISLRFI